MSDTLNAGMREFWNGEGGHRWVRFQHRLDQSLVGFGQAAMEAAAFSTGEQVMDIGCGCGDTSFEIARQVGPNGHVKAVDISEPILAQAITRVGAEEVQNISFEHGDAQTHRFEATAFDAVFSRFGIMFFDDPVAAFSNIRKALKHDGRLAFICWQPVKANTWVSLPLTVVGNHLPLPLPPGPEEPGPFSFGDADKLERVLVEAGFSDVLIKSCDTPFTVAADDNEAAAFLMQMGPANGAISEADADEATKSLISAELREALMPYRTEQGIVLDAATWVVTAYNR